MSEDTFETVHNDEGGEYTFYGPDAYGRYKASWLASWHEREWWQGRGYEDALDEHIAEYEASLKPKYAEGGYLKAGKGFISQLSNDAHYYLVDETGEATNITSAVQAADFSVSSPQPGTHPNFVQVYLEEDNWTTSYEASRTTDAYKGEVSTSPWVIPEQHISALVDIEGLRLLLDEIEARIVEDSAKESEG